MNERNEDTDQLVQSAADGDVSARHALLHKHRERLKQMVAMRMDKRACARFDPSDVVQEALVTANERLTVYLNNPNMPFYPWLRRIAWERLLKFHKEHVHAQKRTVEREAGHWLQVNNDSVHQLADLLAGSVSAPSKRIMQREDRQKLCEALGRLRSSDREILELLYLEQLSVAETAATLGVSSAIVRKRHFRAIRRLSQQMESN